MLILDTLVSSILGRPGGLPQTRPNDQVPNTRQDGLHDLDRSRSLASHATFAICSHIIELQQKLVVGGVIDVVAAEKFLRRLRQWNEGLPAELRHFESVKDRVLDASDRELFLGAVHVACTYYFTIILVTRPFLIARLMARIGTPRTKTTQDTATEVETESFDLAQACQDAAMFMANTGAMAMSSGIPANNLCIIK